MAVTPVVMAEVGRSRDTDDVSRWHGDGVHDRPRRVSSVPVKISVVSPEEREHEQAGNGLEPHYNIRLAPDAAP